MLAGDDTLECTGWSKLKEITDKKVLVLGSGSDDESYCKSSGWTLSSIEEASLIISRGTFTICDGESIVHKDDNPDQYVRVLHHVLKVAARRKLPMLVCNPDKVRPDEGFPPMPGAIADQYEQILGSPLDANLLIRRIGKPFPEVYEIALKGRAKTDVCMVGDALETDMTGGAKLGINTVWIVNDGIHGPEVSESGETFEEGVQATLDNFLTKKGTYADGVQVRPSVVLRHFQW